MISDHGKKYPDNWYRKYAKQNTNNTGFVQYIEHASAVRMTTKSGLYKILNVLVRSIG